MSTGKQIQSWPLGPKSNDFSNSPSLCRVNFEPSGRYLAIPAFTTSTVKILDRGTWKEAFELTDSRLKDVIIHLTKLSYIFNICIVNSRYPSAVGRPVESF